MIVAALGLAVYMLYDMYAPQMREMTGVKETGASCEIGGGSNTDGTDAEEVLRTESELPARYDCREAGKAPTVKNQGEIGNCWAVAASSVLESALLPEESAVFSAEHIAAAGGLESGAAGGSFTMAAAYLAAWHGPVTEEQDPYGDGISPDGVLPVKHVQEIQFVQDRNLEDIKKLIYSCGAVQSSMYMDMGGEKRESPYFDPETASYRYTGSEEVNHDIIIIGWDDDYPAGRFTFPPEKNGAFICQNSWGKTFGEDGVFYVSYEDTAIAENCGAYTRIDSADNYERLYQTDPAGYTGQMGYGKNICWFANVYETLEDEVLRAVGFYALGRNTRYEVLVAQEFQNVFSLTLAEMVQEGSFERPGFYTVDLQKTFAIPKGQMFAVMVKIDTPGSRYPVAMEYPNSETGARGVRNGGEGYVSPDGLNFTNTEIEYEGNVCLKAYTDKDERK